MARETLIAAFDVVTGQVQGSVGDTRTQEDYVAFLNGLFNSSHATTQWRIVCDNLNTHVSEGVVRLVAQRCGIEKALGRVKTKWRKHFQRAAPAPMGQRPCKARSV